MAEIQNFSVQSIFAELPEFSARGINELNVFDKKLSGDREKLILLAKKICQHAPELFLSVLVDPRIVDKKFLDEFSRIYFSLELDLSGTEKNGTLLFDKKFYSAKAKLLNDNEVVFGFNMDFGQRQGDTFRLFRDRLDFAVTLYPNHINFHQLEDTSLPPSTGIYSSKDLDFSRGMAFACKTFYSAGRAVSWFNPVLKMLRINASSFFADFEEWQHCNNCSLDDGFDMDRASHADIEKMQLNFLEQKFTEKNKKHAFPAAADLVKINGAFSRAACEGEETVLETSYHPDDILSPYAMDLAAFTDNVTMESCSVRVYPTKDGGIDFKIL